MQVFRGHFNPYYSSCWQISALGILNPISLNYKNFQSGNYQKAKVSKYGIMEMLGMAINKGTQKKL